MSDASHEHRRFWYRVEQGPDGCWLWVGGRRASGYGMFAVRRTTGAWTQTTSHRWAYEAEVGPIPPGHEVDHLCRVRNCVRPDHLEAVTVAENRRRRYADHGLPISREPRAVPTVGARPVGARALRGQDPAVAPSVRWADARSTSGSTSAPRAPGTCRRGHLVAEVGQVKNGRAMTCAACREQEYAARRTGNTAATRTTCPQGHAYSEENTRWRTDAKGRRSRGCITCDRASARRQHARRSAERAARRAAG